MVDNGAEYGRLDTILIVVIRLSVRIYHGVATLGVSRHCWFL